jgi:hypothetical protein
MVSVALVSLLILLLLFHRYEQLVQGLVEWVLASNRNLAGFMLLIVILPMILIFL